METRIQLQYSASSLMVFDVVKDPSQLLRCGSAHGFWQLFGAALSFKLFISP